MEEFVNAALEKASELNVEAEVRFSSLEEEITRVKKLETEIAGYEHTIGLGVTVYHNGSYGFSSTSLVSKENAARIVEEAFSIAKARSQQKKIQLFFPELSNVKDERNSEYKIDPFSIPTEEKVNFLLRVNQEALDQVKGITILPVSMIRSFKKKVIYANTKGAYIIQNFVSCGAEVQIYAFSDNELQVRSYPARDSSYYQKGYEVISELDLIEGARVAAEEATELLKAENCRPGEYEAVISQDQMALQIHESIGHPSELDRALGFEVSLAGASFLKAESRGRFEIASKNVNIVADATMKNALGSFYYDDEGTPAQRFYVVENGVFKNFLSSRESATSIGEQSNGCARAESALKLPIVRMTNLSLLPDESGPGSLEEMISDIKEGIYLKTTRSWSIDDLRLNFQFAVEYAREIKNGRLGKVIKNANYTGITPNFWKSVVSIGNEKTFKLYGFTNCGKGDPIQLASVGHGSPIVLVRNLKVGSVR
ncbi:MAG: TldD/PmbA family protein [Actinobacteria bacterium]|nr:TldD/PmbA family protein [Actinomycetota bacterium]